MQCSVLCILLLAISEPLLTHAKVVVIVPRQVRRSPVVPWRPPGHYKKSSYGGNDFPRYAHYGRVNRYYNKKPFQPSPYGGDDFDHTPETVNHVNVPYGKDISHGISFGKGYIPYDNIKSNNLPFVHERYAGQQPAIPGYPPTSFTSTGQEYTAAATAHSYENPQIDSYFSDMESATRGGSLKDNINKYYGTRSIEKDLSLRNHQALSSIIEKTKDYREDLAKGTDGLPSDAPPAAYAHAASASTSATIPVTSVQGAVIVPQGIPSATIAGNKDGIVLRDTVSLDEYQKKLEELTKTWPNVLSTGANFAATQQQHGLPGGYIGLPGVSFGGPTGGANWLSSIAQSKQGYAVREDHGDPTTYDFRTMSVQGAPYQHVSFGHGGISSGTGIGSSAHG